MQQTEQTTNAESPQTLHPVQLDPEKFQEFRRQLEREQNLPAGVVAGLVAAIAGAVAWAVITVTTQYQIGWMAIGVGFLVGLAVRKFGRGITTPFAVAGCLLALLGCLLGNLLSACGFISVQQSIPLTTILSRLDAGLAAEIMKATFSPMDLLFYGFAWYAGYKYSLRVLTPEEVQSMARPNV